MTTGIDVTENIRRAKSCLLGQQRPDGHWVGEMEGDTILESEYILLMCTLGIGDEFKLTKAAEYIRRKQLPDGGWAIYPDGPPDLSASVKAYFALKLTGTAPDEPYMKAAQQSILDMGGAGLCNSYTKFYLAALGQIPWDDAPAVPPEIVLLPSWFYFNLYEISSWSRTFVVPLSIIWAHKPVVELSSEGGIRELFLSIPPDVERYPLLSGKRFFLMVDGLLKLMEHRRMHWWRKNALHAAEQWMLDHFEGSSGLGGIYPPIIYSLMALWCLGYADDHPQMVRVRKELDLLAIEEHETMRLQPCKSPVWDTATAVNAIRMAGTAPNNQELMKAAEWLVSKQVINCGDWSVKRPGLQPGGWYFEYENEFYPDIDDTAMVLLALKGLAPSDTLHRGINWILAMQGKDGGWASFDVDNNRKLFCSIPFADHNAMIDPSTADVTARVLEMLGAYGYDQSNPQVKRGVRYLLQEQEPDGAWFGRWGVNYIYGTFQSLKGLAQVGLTKDHPSIVRGADWLVSCQNPDGGWGETLATYEDPSLRGKGVSTASQTAWALIGLMVAGRGDNDAVHRGVEFLVRTQNQDGSWDEDQWTGTGFPKVFYLKYHLYRQSFPLWALGMYAQQRQTPGSTTSEEESGRVAV